MKKKNSCVVLAAVLIAARVSADDSRVIMDRSALASALSERVSAIRLCVYADYDVVRRTSYNVGDENAVLAEAGTFEVFGLHFVVPTTRSWLYLEADLIDERGATLFGGEKSFHAKKIGTRWQVPDRATYLFTPLWFKVPVSIDGLVAGRFETQRGVWPSWVQQMEQRGGRFMFLPYYLGTSTLLRCQFSDREESLNLNVSVVMNGEEDWWWMVDPAYVPPEDERDVRVVIPELTIQIPELSPVR